MSVFCLFVFSISLSLWKSESEQLQTITRSMLRSSMYIYLSVCPSVCLSVSVYLSLRHFELSLHLQIVFMTDDFSSLAGCSPFFSGCSTKKGLLVIYICMYILVNAVLELNSYLDHNKGPDYAPYACPKTNPIDHRSYSHTT